jgi:mono/diheme cytochrome c family protein
LQHQVGYAGTTVPLSNTIRSLGSSLALTASLAVTAAWFGCAPSPGAGPSRTPTAETKPEPAPSAAPDGGAGGRVFDKWYEGKTFKPDDAKTPQPDGSGGPLGDGRLKAADGSPAVDAHGHQTRLKNLFGWDLRGAAGIYGPKYQKKKYVLDVDLLQVEASRDDFVRWFTSGQGGIPAFGDVLEKTEIDALVDFVVSMREGKIARPEQIFALSETAPGNYTLLAGADPARGAKLISERCATCHGTDGTTFLFDDGEYSLGSHARQKAYEDWMKILNGQPGTAMGRQVKGKDGKEMASEILDILAALCDRKAFPKGKATGAEVADGDARCGAYLR